MLVFGALKSLLPKVDATVIDNNVFRLHYKFTVVVLIAFTILVTSRENIGDPIVCEWEASSIPEKMVNQFCWIQSTFSMEKAFHMKVGVEVPYPGVINGHKAEERRYHKYYQWVCFMLFFQAILFYLPRYLWKIWEGGKMKALVLELNLPIMPDSVQMEKINLLVDYLFKSYHSNNSYVMRYFVSELLNLANVIGQIYMTDRFLGYEFTQYGTQVIQFSNQEQEDRVDPMIRIFPRMAKCTFHHYGRGGDVEKHDVLCVLPINVVNEKIYIFLWFWFIILAVLSCACLIYRLCILFIPQFRVFLLRRRAPHVSHSILNVVLRKAQIGDWFVIYLLSKNMQPFSFRNLMDAVAGKLEASSGIHTVTSESKNKKNKTFLA